jgi:hypothetical protein
MDRHEITNLNEDGLVLAQLKLERLMYISMGLVVLFYFQLIFGLWLNDQYDSTSSILVAGMAVVLILLSALMGMLAEDRGLMLATISNSEALDLIAKAAHDPAAKNYLNEAFRCKQLLTKIEVDEVERLIECGLKNTLNVAVSNMRLGSKEA